MTTPLKEQICQSTDHLNTLRRAYYQGSASYDAMVAAATALIELRQQAEIAFYGKVKTKLTPRSIASLLRSA